MQMTMRVVSLVLLLGCLVGCAATSTPTPVATQPLRTPSPTPTLLPVTPTATPQGLLSAVDVNTSPDAPINNSLTPLLPGDVSLSIDFLQQMQADLAERIGTSPQRIFLASIETGLWADEDLGCTVSTSSFSQGRSGYAVKWLLGDSVYSVHTEGEARYVLCPGAEVARNDLLLSVDLIANDLLALAQRRLARELDLPQERIQLESIFPVTWTDTSLGCPQPDTQYAPAELRGYRIVVTAGDASYIYHTDDSRLVPCTPDLEQLPPGLLDG